MGDFDFLIGSWLVANRRLRERLVGCTEWEEFEATSRAWPLLDGGANIDEFRFPDGTLALTLRLFDPDLGHWSLYWATSVHGVLLPPVRGGFVDGVGTFYGDDVHEGTPVRVRYIWSGITATEARWEQAYSADGERNWETNWIMQLQRT
jgi:hypothetical protein